MADFCPVCTGVPGMGSPPVAIFPGLGLLTRQSAGKIPHRVVNRCRKGCCKSIQSRDGPRQQAGARAKQWVPSSNQGPRTIAVCRTKARGTDPGGIGRPTALTTPGGLPRRARRRSPVPATGPGHKRGGGRIIHFSYAPNSCTQRGGPGELASRQDRDTSLSGDVNRSAHSARSSFKPKLRSRPRSAARQAYDRIVVASAW
jgi:hypothetical protein